MTESISPKELRFLLFKQLMEKNEEFSDDCNQLRDALLSWSRSLRAAGLTPEEACQQWG